MTTEEKQLLLKDLCARLSYEAWVWVQYDGKEWLVTGYGHGRVSLLPSVFSSVGGPCPLVEEVRPYLRPMSSMTEVEQQKYYDLTHQEDDDIWGKCLFDKMVDFCNENHLDYRGLIEKGLALEAPEGMYKEN